MSSPRIFCLAFSPAGSTRKVCAAVAKGIADTYGSDVKEIDFTKVENRKEKVCFTENDLLVVGFPTYAGKLPNKILPDLKACLHGTETKAVGVVLFGNRSPDNAPAELFSVLQENGFIPAGCAVMPARHVFSDCIAPGRPTDDDLKEAERFGREVSEKLLNGDLSVPALPGDADAPYYVPKGLDGQPAKFLKAKPVVDPALCSGCGICAEHCPISSIQMNTGIPAFEGTCIKCQACRLYCPKGAIHFEDEAFLSHIAMLEQNYTSEKQNHFYL